MIELTQRVANLNPARRELLRRRVAEHPEAAEPIAIVGMGCRFAGARDLDSFWRIIHEGRTATAEVPLSRWNADEYYDEDYDAVGKMATRWGGFIDDVDQFDPQFFGIAPREAERMDPQQRLLLEVSWEALEHAGVAPERLRGSATGVFVGIGGTDYSKVACQHENYLNYIDAHVGTGNALSISANRVSYLLDFHGPSLAIDTACSSGLVGIHMAVQSLRNWECDAALAGGVNLILAPDVTIAFSKARMLSSDGKCRPFDAGANGYVRGEGCAMIVLKRLTDALRDGDHVLAVIRGSAVNQDGATSGITAPNSLYQQAAIRAALDEADLTPDDVSYIEAHGTGTPLGDPIEAQSLGEVFPRRGDDEPPVYVASVKANIGHTETVSGVAGVIKTVLLMQHGVIVPQAHLEKLNPHIQLDGTRLVFPTEPVAWSPNRPRIAGVSSFGFGGTNAHVVLEAAPTAEAIFTPVRRREGDDALADRPLHMLAISTKSKTAMPALAGRYAEFLRTNEQVSLADFCYSANTGRTHFNHRLAITADQRETLIDKLTALAEGAPTGAKISHVSLASRPRVAFLFTGQGSQYAGMGRMLYATQPTFRGALNQCAELLDSVLERPLLSVLYGNDDESPIDQTVYTQPALFAIEYALAALWRSWGVEPDLVLGHSVGEYVAAVIAGVMRLEDAARLIAHRARLMQTLPANGSMAVIFAPYDAVTQAIQGRERDVAVAAANGPENTVLSGKSDVVREIAGGFEERGVRVQMLGVSHAFHSPLMEPMLDEFERLAAEIEYHRPTTPIVCNVTGELAADDTYNARYWRDHIRGTVRFEESVRHLETRPIHAVLEVGPAPVLLGMARRCLTQSQAKWLPSLRPGQDDWKNLLGALEELYCTGVKVNWFGFDRDWPRRRWALPTYPFERTRMWLEMDQTPRRAAGGAGPKVHPLLGRHVPSALESTLYEVALEPRSPKYLIDHQVQGSIVTPAAAYLEQALAAAELAFGPGRHAVDNVSIQQAMFLPERTGRTVQVTVSPELGGRCTFETYSMAADGEKTNWRMHAAGALVHGVEGDENPPATIDLEAVRAGITETLDRETFYAGMASRGLVYGPAFQVLAEMQRSPQAAIARVAMPDEVVKESAKYHVHPALLDGCLQAMAGAIPPEADGSQSPYAYMPVAIGRMRVYGPIGGEMYVYLARTSDDNSPSPETVEADVLLLDAQGRVLVGLEGVRVQRLGRAVSEKPVDMREWLYELQWRTTDVGSETAAPSTTDSAVGQTSVAPTEVTAQPGSTTLAGNWILLADRKGIADALAKRIQHDGGRPIFVRPGEAFATASEGNGHRDHFVVDPLSEDDFRRLIEASLGGENAECRGVIHLWSLDLPLPHDDAAGAFADFRKLGCGGVLRVVQQLAKSKIARPPRLWLVTQGAQAVNQEDNITVAQSPLWGMGRVAALEHPELRARLIDLDPAANAESSVEFFIADLAAEPDEDQIAYRGPNRFVARLAAAPEAFPDGESAGMTVPREGAFRIRLGKPGSMDSLQVESFTRHTPEPGQVELEVRAAGLNFSDVLKAMGLYPGIKDKLVPLGIECSGVVTAVGEGVERFRVGDAVMGVAPYSFASHARTAEYALVHKPASLDDSEACTVPIAFLTAYYALVRLAQLQPNERVLIHAGAGGVGLAAIQIAQHIGAEIFATAGSDEKRDYLRSLGVPHVLNSRTLEFADAIRQLTRNQGVDVVLNSLPGEAIDRSIGALAAYGRFCEIGKTDIYQNRKIGLLPFQDNLSYFAIDLDRMLRQRPDFMRSLFAEMMRHFESGAYHPVIHTEFPLEETVAAFRYMAQRKNIGKVVVSLESRRRASVDKPHHELIRSDGAYLITGGLGALGLKLARWLAEQGAGRIVLLARRAPGSAEQLVLDELKQSGVDVVALQGDVADLPSLQNAIVNSRTEGLALRGVFHAAGVLDDGVMFDMDLERLDRPMSPKVQGAWNLHVATQDADLDLFVLFSSVACILGSPGQANYAAGNAFLDGLAAYRKRRGLPATCINWGPWAEGGMAAEGGRNTQLSSRGMDALPADACLRILEQLLRTQRTQTAVMNVRWRDMVKQTTALPPLLRDVAPSGDTAEEANPADSALRAELAAADPATRIARLIAYFTEQLATIMGLEADKIDAAAPLTTIGLDSLMAIELKNKIETRLQVVVPMARFMEGPSVTTLAQAVAELISDGAAPTSNDGAASAKREERAEAKPAAESRADRVPLTHGQQALWFIQQLAPESTAYHLADAVRIDGPLQIDAMHQAMQQLVNRHSIFRTTIHEEDGEPYQVVRNEAPVPFVVEDAAGWTPDEVQQRLRHAAECPFDLVNGPLGRMVVLKLAENQHVMVFVVHHLIADMWSMVSCAAEIKQLYAAALANQAPSLPAPEIEFADFARRHREMLDGAQGERLWQYWRQELDGELPVLELPTDKPRPKVQTYDGELVVRVVDKSLAQEIQEVGRRHGATLNMVLLGAYEMLLSRYTGQNEVLVGIPASGRTRSELKGVMGYFVNPVVIRGDLTQDATAGEFLEQIRDRIIGALEHQDYPFPLLVERLAPSRHAGRPPVFQTMFAMQQFHLAKREGLTPFLAGASNEGLELLGLRFEPAGLEQRVTPFDLSLTASEGDDEGIALVMQYNTDLFRRETVERMLTHFENLLRALVENENRPVDELPILADKERQQEVKAWNETRRDYPRRLCLHDLIEAQVERTPEAPAIICRAHVGLSRQISEPIRPAALTMSYRALNEQANQLAHHLNECGVGPESTVGLCIGRGAPMIVALLGILKAGGSYVPIDPDLPVDRKLFMLADAGVEVVVTEEQLASRFGEFAGQLVRLDADADVIATRECSNRPQRAAPSNRAYVIYTSGSTGQPKGVEIEHAAIVNYVQSAVEQFKLTKTDRVLQFASISFDASAEEIFPTLASGGALVIRDDTMSLAAEDFLNECDQLGVTVLDLPTAYWRHLVQEIGSRSFAVPSSLRLVVIGGERAEPQHLALWQRTTGGRIRLLNTYGPTETTVVATSWEAPADWSPSSAEIPIGLPVANVEAFVLDRRGQLVPTGVAGELHIGGTGLARGYLNRPELTAEKFIPHPFRAGARVYKTGDRVRRLPDGNLQFLGRLDDQVKIRGFRVELGEIEAALCAHDRVRQCVVRAWLDTSGQSRLAAYLVPDGPAPEPDELRRYLGQRLPDHMIPAAFVTLESLPLNRSHKVDRNALPEPIVTRSDRKTGFLAPRNEIELELTTLWEDVLGVAPIGMHDNFFDLGGHSMLAVQLVSRIRKHFQRSVPLSALLSDGTIERMAVLIEQLDDDRPWSPLVPIRPHGALAPLFCIHPAGGNVLSYYELAHHLDPDRPVYAIQARGVDGAQPPHARLDEMVDAYVTAIRSVQPSGPYHLVGWSSGGVVAYAIALQLREAGEEIGSVALIDSRVMSSLDFDPDDESRILVTLADFLERFYGFPFHVTYEELEPLEREARLTHLLEKAKIVGQAPMGLDADDLRALVEVARANLKILKDYAPPASDLPVRLYRAGERRGEQDGDLRDDLGWRAVVGDALVVAEVTGDHITMMTGEHAQRLASAIEAALPLSH